ncbi:MAG: hypothetical protein ACD_46C00428G0002 [uncultured bacterium]|nr:MAG: hypothetical protein ACD_46C00428G0002 [uncultured bacterium]
MKDISVLIVNFNTAELVKKCIESILKQRDVRFEMIVVDNHSHDESVSILREFGSDIKLIVNQDNKGFGAANNQAFRQSGGRYLFLLNPDAICLTELDLYHAVRFMDNHPECGLAGTRIIDSENHLQTTAWDHYPRQDQAQIDFSGLPGTIATVLGASMIIRRDAYAKVGGFDEDFFLYAEETDLCLRLRKQGYMIGFCDDITVQHVGGASEKSYPREDVIRRKKSAKYLFYSKHYHANDVIRMIKHDLNHARFHLWKLKIKKLFFKLNAEQQAKLTRHLVSYELAKAYLKAH